jgi:hypothetical protein
VIINCIQYLVKPFLDQFLRRVKLLFTFANTIAIQLKQMYKNDYFPNVVYMTAVPIVQPTIVAPDEQYEYTGKLIGINPYDTSLYVTELLSQYDSRIDEGEDVDHNPYTDKIVMTVGGKHVQIPKDMQQTIVEDWIKKRKENTNEFSVFSGYIQFAIMVIVILLLIFFVKHYNK